MLLSTRYSFIFLHHPRHTNAFFLTKLKAKRPLVDHGPLRLETFNIHGHLDSTAMVRTLVARIPHGFVWIHVFKTHFNTSKSYTRICPYSRRRKAISPGKSFALACYGQLWRLTLQSAQRRIRTQCESEQ